MSVLTAFVIVLTVIVVADLALTAALVHRLRTGTIGARKADLAPVAGHVVRLDADGQPWAREASGLLQGKALVLLVSPTCAGCARLAAELARVAPLSIPVHAVVEGSLPSSDGDRDVVAAWSGVDAAHVSPVPLADLDSFARPGFVPTAVLLSDGMVVASGYRLRDLPLGAFVSSVRTEPST